MVASLEGKGMFVYMYMGFDTLVGTRVKSQWHEICDNSRYNHPCGLQRRQFRRLAPVLTATFSSQKHCATSNAGPCRFLVVVLFLQCLVCMACASSMFTGDTRWARTPLAFAAPMTAP